MEERASSERKSLLIRVILVVILLLLSFLATVLYVFLYPKTTIIFYDSDYSVIETVTIKKYSTLSSIGAHEKPGYTFINWTYDDFGGEELDPNREVDTDVVKLYANYKVNRYTVTYYIHYIDPVTGRDGYLTDVEWCRTRTFDYGTEFTLPTGMDNNFNIIPEIQQGMGPGYHFVGWTTKIVKEDDPEINKYLRKAGTKFVVDVPSDISLYAHWEKNSYAVNLHTGIKYVLDENGNPIKVDGEYVIHNLDAEDDPSNERESLVKGSIKYRDNLMSLTEGYKDFKLTEKNAGIAHGEYDFLGWYIDPEYKYSVNDNNVIIRVDDSGRPYYSFKDEEQLGEKKYARVASLDTEGKPIYEFDLYSKWQRRSYLIDFNKNSNRSNGKIQPIRLYKLFLDEDEKIIEEFGKYYDEGWYTYEGAQNGGKYARVNLNDLSVVDQKFRDSNIKFRLTGWAETSKSKDRESWYASWDQADFNDDLGLARTTAPAVYTTPVYIHKESNDKVLFAQWDQIYDIKFAYAFGPNQKNFILQGISGEWFILPNMAKIKELTGDEWTKEYNRFAGWTSGTSSLSDKWYDKPDNPDFMYSIGTTNATLAVLWERIEYTINFCLNYKDDQGQMQYLEPYKGFGGVSKFYPSSPTREGYIFDGWSKTNYHEDESKENQYSIERRKAKDEGRNLSSKQLAYTSSSNFKIEGDTTYYASWTRDFEFKYTSNSLQNFGPSSKTTIKYSELLAKTKSSTSDFKINLYVGQGVNNISREYYDFIGWNVKGSPNDAIIKHNSNKRTTFDFYEQKYYAHKSSGTPIKEADKVSFSIDDGVITIQAQWEPKIYTITIVDTKADSDVSNSTVYKVTFEDVFEFPASSVYDNKIGFKFKGYSLARDGSTGILSDQDTITGTDLTSHAKYYTIYEDMKVYVDYAFIKYSVDDQGNTVEKIENYDPNLDTIVGQNKIDAEKELIPYGYVDYGAVIKKLPVMTNNHYDNSGKYLFKYWYYLKDGIEVKVNAGERVAYHEEIKGKETFMLYAKYEIDQYDIALSITNPYTGEIMESAYLMSIPKSTQITATMYEDLLKTVDEKVTKYFANYKLYDSGVYNESNPLNKARYILLKGYTLSGIFSVGGTSSEFINGVVVKPDNFDILGITRSGMTIQTQWTANNVNIIYRDTKGYLADVEGSDVSYDSKEIRLKDSNTFDYSAHEPGLNLTSWYIAVVDKNDPSLITDQVFMDCGSVMVGTGARFTKIHDIAKYISWDEITGEGTLVIYSNTAMVWTVIYHVPSILGINALDPIQFSGDAPALLSGDDPLVVEKLGNFKFEGWYFEGTQVSEIPLDKGAEIHLYADASITVSYQLVKIDGNVILKEIIATPEVIHILQDYDHENATAIYNRIYVLDTSKVPTLPDGAIPDNYIYYGMRNGEIVYSMSDIANGVNIAIDGNNILLETYYTIEYKIVYTLQTGEKFIDGSSVNKEEIVHIGYDASEKLATINQVAKKQGYLDSAFAGWQIKTPTGLSAEVYSNGASFPLTTIETTLVASFNAPDVNTITGYIKLKPAFAGLQERKIAVKNGVPYQLQSNSHPDVNWASTSYEVYAWTDNKGNTYKVNDMLDIPQAILPDTVVYELTAQWTEKYVVTFKQPKNYLTAEYSIKQKTIYKNDCYQLIETPKIAVDGIEFKNWVCELNGETLYINVYDIIYVGAETFSTNNIFAKVDIGGTQVTKAITEYYLPASSDGIMGYTFVGSWTTASYDVVLNITNPADKTKVINTVTMTKVNGNAVSFGTTYTDRELIPADIITNYEDEDNVIVGWAYDKNATDPIVNILSNIHSNMTLYSVWQSRVDIVYAAKENIKYNNGTMLDSLRISGNIPNSELDLNNVLEKMYYTNNTMVYHNGERYIENVSGAGLYYRVVGFNLSWNGGANTSSVELVNNTFASVLVPASELIITPIIEKVYRVAFYDNTTSEGGNLIAEYPAQYYRPSEATEDENNPNVVDLSPELYNITRGGFSFSGWNTSVSAVDYLSGKYKIEKDENFYAVWTSTRVVNFVATFTNNGYTSTSTVISGFKLNRLNKINTELLGDYLKDPSKSNNLIRLNKDNGYKDLEKFPAYRYNNKNWYLDGFIVKNNSGVPSVVQLDNLGEIDFGSTEYVSNENITITINFKDIYTIRYAVDDNDDVDGEINTPEYFVFLDNTRYGKLSGTTIGALVLPGKADIDLTRENHEIYGWSTSATDESSSAQRYNVNIDNAEDQLKELTLDKNEIQNIITELNATNKQEYVLYADWQQRTINVFVYAIANIINNPSGEDTTFVDPYTSYLNASTVEDIAFSNVSKYILERNSASGKYSYVYLNNYDFNNGADPKIAGVRYGKNFAIDPTVSSNSQFIQIGDIQLIGWSTTFYKLGETPDKYYRFGEIITVDDTVIKDNVIKLYPVYIISNETIEMRVVAGSARVAVSGVNQGQVSISGMEEKEIDCGQNYSAYESISFNKYQTITINADGPMNDKYVFDDFEGAGSTDAIDSQKRVIDGAEHFADEHDDFINVVFSAKKVKLSITLDYEHELKDMTKESTNFDIDGANEVGDPYHIILNADNRTATINTTATSYFGYHITDLGDYYDYQLLSAGAEVTLVDGEYVDISTLQLSETAHEGYYSVSVIIRAIPKTYTVRFQMTKGSFVNGTTVDVESNNDYNISGVGYIIENNIAYVPRGSRITLPDKSDLQYLNGGKFLGFYLSGGDGSYITSCNINANTTIVEAYDNNSYYIQYVFRGNTYMVSGISGDDPIVIGCPDARNVNGYRLVNWTDQSGNTFADNVAQTITRSYILYANYVAEDITIEYKYNDGLTTTHDVVSKYEQNFSTLTESSLPNMTPITNQYINGWRYNGRIFKAGELVNFANLGYTYDANNTTLVFEAVYYAKYEYQMTYDTSTITNPEKFSTTTHYVLGKTPVDQAENKEVDASTLVFNVSAVEPEKSEQYFDYYEVKYSIDGGSSFVDIESTDTLLGSSITLIDPIEKAVAINVPVIYVFTPKFKNSATTIEITYKITNPMDNAEIITEGEYLHNASNQLSDENLPQIVDYSNDNQTSNWTVKTNTFSATKEGVDFRKYNLIGYTLYLHNASGDILSTEELRFGDLSNRNIKGANSVTITTQWQELRTIKYVDNDAKEIVELRQYIDTNSDVILKTQEEFNAVTDKDSFNVEDSDYKWLGWIESSDNKNILSNDAYMTFGQTIVADRDYILYPALSKLYDIEIITAGIDDGDGSQFTADNSVFADEIVFVGMNEINSIDMSKYGYEEVYGANCNTTKYTFLGYSNAEDGEPNNLQYLLDINNISGDKLNIYAIWSKNTYSVIVDIEAINNSGTNMGEGHSITLTQVHDEPIDLTTNEQINNAVVEFLASYPYFTQVGIYISSEVDPITTYVYNISGNITIKFAPKYTIHYQLFEGATLDGFDANNSFVVANGDTFENKYVASNINATGYNITHWTHASDSYPDMANFFNGDNEAVIDFDKYAITDEYVIVLVPAYSTMYTVTLHYMDDIQDIIDYNQAISANPYMTVAEKNQYFKSLTTLTLSYGDVLFEVIENAGDIVIRSIYDEYLASNPVTILGNSITTFDGLLGALATEQYESKGLVTINDSLTKFALLPTMAVSESLYFVQTYSGEATVNDLYLVYTPITYKVQLGTMVVDSSGNYSQEINNNNLAIAEVAYNEDQRNDNGASGLENAKKRQLIFTTTHGQRGQIKGVENTFNYSNTFYLYNANAFVRANQQSNNNRYNFVGWKVMNVEYETEANGDYKLDANNQYIVKNVTFENLSNYLTISEKDGEITVSNVRQNILLVAIYQEKVLDVEITITSTNNIGHLLDVKLETADSDSDDFVTLAHTTIKDEDEKKATISLQLRYSSWLSISCFDPIANKFVISRISDGMYTYGSAINLQITNSLIYSGKDKVEIAVEYTPKTYNVYLSTARLLVDWTEYFGEIESAQYILGEDTVVVEGAPDIVSTSKRETYNNGVSNVTAQFNYQVKVLCDSKIDNNFATPILNNHEFSKWQYIGTDNKLHDLDASGLAVNGNVYLIAVYVPKTVIIKYYIDSVEIKGIISAEPSSSYAGLIVLPAVAIELNNRITYGWNVNGVDYAWGDSIRVRTPNNEALEVITDGPNAGNLIFKISANFVNRYYVVYANNEDKQFNIPNDYPTSASDDSVVFAEKIDRLGTCYYLRIRSDTVEEINVAHSVIGGPFVRSNSITLPSAQITSTSGVAFVGWKSNTNKTYNYGSTYKYNANDVVDGKITLTAINSNYIKFNFYITNPNNKNNTIKLSEQMSGTADIECISLVLDKTAVTQYVAFDGDRDNLLQNQITSWKVFGATPNKNYYTTDATLSNIILDHRFFGWSTNKHDAFSNISNVFTYTDVVTVFNDSYVGKTDALIKGELTELSRGTESGVVNLYTVWEKRYEVSFVDRGTTIASGKYAMGEEILVPNPRTHTLTNGTKKWLGWSATEQSDIRFDEGTTKIYGSGTTIAYDSIWLDGYTLSFNSNFSKYQEEMKLILRSYVAVGDYDSIIISYPSYANPTGYELAHNGSDSSGIIYKYGDIWGIGEKINISQIKFSDEGIYPTSLSLSSATWLPTYYTFVGWTTDADGNNMVTNLEEYTITKNTVLYAKWEEISLKIYASPTQEEAENHVNTIELGSFSVGLTFDNIEKHLDNGDRYFSKTGYKFKNWTSSNLAVQAGSIGLINEIYLYPDYELEYTVRFMDMKGNEFKATKYNEDTQEIEDVDNQKVIASEKFEVANWIKNKLHLNPAHITSVSTMNIYDVEVPLTSIDGQSLSIFEEVSMQEKNIRAYGNDIIIYIGIDISVNRNIPSVTESGEYEQDASYNIQFNSPVIVHNGKIFTDAYRLDTSRYDSENVPELEGWYYRYKDASGNDQEIKIVTYEIQSRSIIVDNIPQSSYVLVINDTNEFELKGRVIDIYARVLISVKISLGEASDNEIVNFAQMSISYDEIDSAYTSLIAKNLNIEQIDGQVKSITYKTIYNSDIHPKIILKTIGYNISSISGLDGIIPSDYSKYAEFEGTNTNTSLADMTLTKTTNTTSGALSIEQILQINAVKKNAQNFVISIEIMKYTIEYKFYESEGLMQYKEYAYSKDYNEYSISGGSHGTEVDYMYNNGSVVELISLDYTYSTTKNANGTNKTEVKITYQDVPYGTTLYINAISKNNYVTSFQTWTTNAVASQIDINNISTKYQPIDIITKDDDTFDEYLTTITMNALFSNNKFNTLTLRLDIEYSIVKDYAPWLTAIGNTTEGIVQEEKKNGEIIRYSIIWKTYDNTDGANIENDIPTTFFAGQDIESFINDRNAAFHKEFDSQQASPNAGEKLTLGQLMNYFWYDDNHPWITDAKDYSSDYVSTGILVDNVIYGQNGANIVLRKNLSLATIVRVSHATVDYHNTANEYNVDRANVQFTNYNKDNGYYVFTNNATTANTEVSPDAQYDSIAIKLPFNNQKLEFNVVPDGANDAHSEYKLQEWKFTNTDSTGTIGTSENKATIELSNGIMSSMMKYNGESSIPELLLRASVVAKTHKVTFINHDGTEIKSINVAYDTGIDNDHYRYKLSMLSSGSSDYTMPKFELMGGSDGFVTFKHAQDVNASQYGDYKYIFKGWKLTQDGTETLNISNTSVINKFSSGVYQDVTLYAHFVEAREIKVAIYNSDFSEETRSFYLMDADFTDDFGNIYSNTSANKSDPLSAYLDKENLRAWINSKFSQNEESYNYYIDSSSNAVTTISDLTTCGVYKIYPAIKLTINLVDHNINGSSVSKDYITLGGKIEFTMTDKPEGLNPAGVLVLGNLVQGQSDTTIKFNTINNDSNKYTGYNFAGWLIGDDLLTIGNKRIVAEKTIGVTMYYNPMFMVKSSVGGSIVFTDSKNVAQQTGVFNNFIDATPSGVQITNEYVSIVHTGYTTSADGFKNATLEIKQDETLLYTIKFCSSVPNVDRIVFRISTINGGTSILEPNQTFYVEDSYGNITIDPCIFPEDAIIYMQDFVITNLPNPSIYSNAYSYNITQSTISGGAKFKVNDLSSFEYNVDKSATLSFEKMTGEMESTVVTVTQNGEYTALINNLTNFRWQYRDSQQIWRDIKLSDSVYVDDMKNPAGGMLVRFVADWISSEIIFDKLSSLSGKLATNEVTIDGKKFSLTAGNKLGGLEYTDYSIKVNDEDIASNSFTLYQGETLTYDSDKNEFYITSIAGRSNQTITIYTSNGYVQGWLFGNAELQLSKITANEFTDMINRRFYAWVEESLVLNVIQELESKMNDEDVIGYGQVSYEVIHPLSNSSKNENIKYYVEGSRYCYISCGVSSIVELQASVDETLGHAFAGIRYFQYDDDDDLSSRHEYASTNNTINKNAYQFANNLIYVSFTANNTASKLYVVDNTNKLLTYDSSSYAEYTIYGGYTINYEKLVNANINGKTIKNGTKVTITDFNNKTIEEFIIDYETNGTNTDGYLYPRNNYKISQVMQYLAYKGNVKIGSNDILSIEGADAGEKVEAKTIAYNYNDNTLKDKAIVLKFNEILSSITMNFKVVINQIDGSSTTNNYLSTDTAYIDGFEDRISSYKFELNNIGSASLNYDIFQGFLMNVAEVEHVIKTSPQYRLLSAKLNPVGETDGIECTYPSNDEILAGSSVGVAFTTTLIKDEYDLTINILYQTIAEVAFKFTLLDHDMTSDYLDVRLHHNSQEYKYSQTDRKFNISPFASEIKGEILFNTESKTNYLKASLIVPKTTQLYTEVKGGRTYLHFYNGYISFSLSYRNTVSYTMGGTSGWRLDTSSDKYSFNVGTVTAEHVGYANGKSLTYNYYAHKSSVDIGSTPILLNADSTIVLDAIRRPVEIYSDSMYWYENYSVLTADDSEEAFIKNAINNTGYGTLFVGLSGIASVTIEDKTNNFIKYGSFAIQWGTADGEVNSYGPIGNGFAPVNDQNAVFTTNLRDSNKWTFVHVPYGDTDKTIRDNHINVTFHSYNRGVDDEVAVQANVDKNIYFNFIRSNGGSSVTYETFLIYKDKTSRLHGGFMHYNEAWTEPNGLVSFDRYAGKSIRFIASDAILNARATNQRTLLVGYEIYDSLANPNPVFRITREDFNSNQFTKKLSELNRDTLHIFPVFENVRVHTVTINGASYKGNDPFLGSTQTAHVLDGSSYELRLVLDTVTLTKSAPMYNYPEEATYYTLKADTGNYVFMGLTTNDTNGDYSLLKLYNSSDSSSTKYDSLMQHDLSSGVNLGGYGTDGAYYIRIQPTRDVTFTQDWRSFGKIVTYYQRTQTVCATCGAYKMKSGYSMASYHRILFNTLVDGMYFYPYAGYVDPYNSTYFTLGDKYYYSHNSTSTEYATTSDLVNVNELYYTVRHHQCDYSINKGVEEYNAGNCRTLRITNYECSYCDCSDSNEEYIQNPHTPDKDNPIYHYGNVLPTETQHFVAYSCLVCETYAACEEWEDHEIKYEWKNILVHDKSCSKCNHMIKKSEQHSGTEIIEYINQYIDNKYMCVPVKKCSSCEGKFHGTPIDHDYKTQNINGICVEYNKIKYTCKNCNYSYEVNGEKCTTHLTKNLIEVHKATCYRGGDIVKYCTKCLVEVKVIGYENALPHEINTETIYNYFHLEGCKQNDTRCLGLYLETLDTRKCSVCGYVESSMSEIKYTGYYYNHDAYSVIYNDGKVYNTTYWCNKKGYTIHFLEKEWGRYYSHSDPYYTDSRLITTDGHNYCWYEFGSTWGEVNPVGPFGGERAYSLTSQMTDDDLKSWGYSYETPSGIAITRPTR